MIAKNKQTKLLSIKPHYQESESTVYKQENIFPNPIFHKSLLYRIYKEQLNNNNKINVSVKK